MTTPGKPPTLGDAPADLAAYLSDVRAEIDTQLERRLGRPDRDPLRLVEAIHYAATGPGKRLRPAIVVAACEAMGGSAAQAMPAAIALELLHAYTLVHDDLPSMDDDDERRGRPTVHIVFGEAAALLAGDGLLTLAFGALAELGAHAGTAVATLARRAGPAELLRGQALDLALHGGKRAPTLPPTIELVEELHGLKTGALFAAAAELGAIAAGADATQQQALAEFGMAFGIAFQYADDRDDGEFAELAGVAATRMKHHAERARTIAAGLGAPNARLVELAAWLSARA